MNPKINQQILSEICDKEDIKYLGFFGSRVRGDERPESDIDVLIDFNHTKSYFQLVRIQEKLEEVLGAKVDLVLRSSLKESIKPYIAKDLVTVYGQR